jgi:hypothetical protein
MSAEPTPPEPPPLPAALRLVWPVIAVGATAWGVAAVAAFAVTGLHSWRPVAVAGLAVGLFGSAIVGWQQGAARRGARGAQIGLGQQTGLGRERNE